MIAIAAASGAMAVAGPVHADSAADGSAGGSPGLVSGNGIQLPVHLPVNVCGNTVNVAGLLNPAMGNTCANKGGGQAGEKEQAATPSGATAHGSTQDSPGLVSGNDIQLPVDVPVNVSGNSVNVVGVGNPVFGNTSVNASGHPEEPVRTTPPEPPTRVTPPPVRSEPPRPQEPPATHPAPPVVRHEPPGTLAHTGTETTTWAAAAASLASLMGGTLLYRRFRTRRPGSEA
ncbi:MULTISPECIES: chaplin [Streptomyces]|uniref:Chaplin n=1 Tax=Streptomyces argyrophylli TaxID=2726118 RepID=A0A6M4PE07_9ACTN|nr:MULTISPECIES: chaplin [Streptomyces]QJS08669.1 chaplin [Streptomyces argyrophyllae]